MELGAVRKRRVVESQSSQPPVSGPPQAARRTEAANRRPNELGPAAGRGHTVTSAVRAGQPESSPSSGRPEEGQEVVIVRRRERDSGDRLRRGSLKSRIFQFKKRKKEPTAAAEVVSPPAGIGAGGGPPASPGEPCKKRREPAVILADQAPPAARDEADKRIVGAGQQQQQLLLQLAPAACYAEGTQPALVVVAANGHHHIRHQQQQQQQPIHHHPSPPPHHHHHHHPYAALYQHPQPHYQHPPPQPHQQPESVVPYPRYRLTNGAQPLAPTSSNIFQTAAATGQPQQQAGRPTVLRIPPSAPPSEATSPSSPSPPSRGQATPTPSITRGLATPTPSASRGLGTPTPSVSRGPATPTPSASRGPATPPSREVEVVLRRRASQPPSRTSPQDSGRLLKSALARHFRNLHCGVSQRSVTGEMANAGAVLSLGLDQYIREVFHQLDYRHTGAVTREDFETLCEVLDLSRSPPPSARNSGLEWLSSYRPRPNSPGSPLRLDRLSEARYKPPQPSPPVASTAPKPPPTNFLWTIGPRPFWELWPQKKRRKKQLSLEDFTRCLLEQWAKTHAYPLPVLGETVWTDLSRQLRQHSSAAESETPQGVGAPTLRSTGPRQQQQQPDDTRARRLIRSVVRVTRRYHVIDRISRRLANLSGHSQHQDAAAATNIVNGNNGHLNGAAAGNGHHHRVPPPHGGEPTDFLRAELNGRGGGGGGATRLSRYSRYINGDTRSGQTRNDLEKQILIQQAEICSLREVVEDLRSSLQLSDAQNLALQVLLRKMKRAEEGVGRKEFRSQMQESEQQLENLVRELKEMSETVYPTMSSQLSSSCNGQDEEQQQQEQLEQQLDQTFSSLRSARQELGAAQQELQQTASRLQLLDRGGGSGDGQGLASSPQHGGEMREAFAALQRAQEEICQLRLSLEVAQAALEQSQRELNNSRQEILRYQSELESSSCKLTAAEKRASQLSQNRRSLLLELQSTKEVLVSSLNKVQDLELESQKVPALESRLQDLERRLAAKKYLVRPLSTIDSGLYSTSDSEQEQDKAMQHTEGASDEDAYSPRDQQPGLPPRPPSARSRDKSATPSRCTTPSSGHHSSGSKLSASSKSPGSAEAASAGGSSGGGDSVLGRLRREVDALKRKLHSAEREWNEERNCLLDELIRRREDYGEMSSDLQVLEAERVRLSLLQDKIKEVLSMLRTLNAMNISPRRLGKLVMAAVDKAVDPLQGTLQVFKFLNELYHSTRDYERTAADQMLARALEAVEGSTNTEDSDSSESLGNYEEGMGTIRLRRPLRTAGGEDDYSIDV